MGNWSHQLVLFIFAVAAHWQALATGGIVMAVVDLLERKRGKNLSWQSYAIIMSAFLLYSVFAAWQDEHRNTESVIGDKSTISSYLAECRLEARLENEYKRGSEGLAISTRQTIDRQQRLSDKQTNDISGCLVLIGKMNPRIRKEIVVTFIPVGKTDPRKGTFIPRSALLGTFQSLLLVTTNDGTSIPRGHKV